MRYGFYPHSRPDGRHGDLVWLRPRQSAYHAAIVDPIDFGWQADRSLLCPGCRISEGPQFKWTALCGASAPGLRRRDGFAETAFAEAARFIKVSALIR